MLNLKIDKQTTEELKHFIEHIDKIGAAQAKKENKKVVIYPFAPHEYILVKGTKNTYIPIFVISECKKVIKRNKELSNIYNTLSQKHDDKTLIKIMNELCYTIWNKLCSLETNEINIDEYNVISFLYKP